MYLIFFMIILMLMPRPSFAEPDIIPFDMAQGEELIVRLPSNPSTGFDWEVVQLPAFIEQVGKREFARDSKRSGIVGVGGVTIWRFHIVSPGTGVIGFTYRRPWETQPPIESVEYRLAAAP